MSASTVALPKRRKPITLGRILLYAFVSVTAFIWIMPIAGAIFASVRPFTDTVRDGFFSWPQSLTLDNYRNAWDQGDIARKYWNTAVILVPALLVHPLLLEHGGVRLQPLLVAVQYPVTVPLHCGQPVAAADHHPAALPVLQPRTASRLAVELGQAQRERLGIILIHIAFQSGFCTFVLSNYMKLLPKSLNEAARMDGAGVWKQYWQIIMPLTLPALAALATLEFTWIYNDFFWAVVLEQQGADRPITSSLANLGGEFFTTTT